ncbi:hypothetical protein [Streptomyces sp. CNQ085]|uniref:hypothetical protein n=1 Tax=Streptomyces sp. CNQ085 TaxID=2886944 RepID=UPI001F508DDC|nr:hypothetical protein [Streptomyces sp. CNQ085]MCI0384022.1 hypothetical protein [Streptomyces sp. CNQ085]
MNAVPGRTPGRALPLGRTVPVPGGLRAPRGIGGRGGIGADGTAAAPGSPSALRREARRLAAVCVLPALSAALLVPLTLPLGWDETVYASRFSPYGPPTPFSAPRTHGVPLLLFPVASWSDSAVLLRVWLLALSSTALYLGFRPWLRVVPRPSAVWVAAALYGSLWTVLFYAGAAMPNHYTAMGALAAVGCFAGSGSGRGARSAGLAAGLAVATLMRPNEGAALAAPLLLAAVAVPAWHGRGRIAAVAAGAAAGALPWAAEAWLRFGGVAQRLAEASEVQGGMRPVLSVADHLTSLDGPLLCRPCTGDGVWWAAAAWWPLLGLLTALGLLAARRTRTPWIMAGAGDAAPLWLAAATAGSLMAQYFLLLPYVAPRFLLPGYALLAVPAALGLLRLADRARRSAPAAVVLTAVLAGHLVVQATLAHTHAGIQEQAREDWQRIAAVLHAHGVRAPCAVTGNDAAIPVAHAAGCVRTDPRAPRRSDAVVMRRADPPSWAREWPRHPVPDTYKSGWTVSVRP